MRWSAPWLRTVVHDIVAVSRERQLTVKAAGLAFHGVNTLVPLVILLLVGVSLADVVEPVVSAIESASGLDDELGADAFADVVGDGADRTRAAILAAAIFLWSAIRAFQAVNTTIGAVYGNRRSQSTLEAARSVSLVTASYAVLFGSTALIVVAAIGLLGISLSLLVPGGFVVVASTIALFAVLLVALFPTYYAFPQADVSAREVFPGTVFAALGLTLLALGFRVYVATAESVDLFGIAGALLIVLTWIYFGALFLLTGSVLNAVLADRVDPDDGWVPVDERPLQGR